jgi:S-adenosylmethionine:tRNA ribosyltransferase-isomerase
VSTTLDAEAHPRGRRIRFELPPGAHAATTPEERGVGRDGVRLLVARPGKVAHHRFRDLATVLDPGDLVVINTSATLPAAIDGAINQRVDGRDHRRQGDVLTVHFSTQLDDGAWVVEPRADGGARPGVAAQRGDVIHLPGARQVRLIAPYPDPGARQLRLWRAEAGPEADLAAYLLTHGRPIEYGHLARRHTLAEHQTVYATEHGSAEMPSAGRPFTTELITRLIARGVSVAPLVLHAGVSSQESHEPPMPERFDVPEVTARLVAGARAAGQRVVAVGTTVVRALETAALHEPGSDDPTAAHVVRPRRGWTDLVLGPERTAHVVSGLITGLHEPEASHLALLQAVAGHDLVQDAYDAAVTGGYLWHEFGDSMLLLP